MKVFDSSALLALIFQEPGADMVAALLAQGDGIVGAVNLAEVVAKMRDHGMDEATADAVRTGLPLAVEPFSASQAARAGHLRMATRALGLSLGDRCCLALAREQDADVITADRPWKTLKGFRITLVR
jgi:ribonuclease VapC